MQKGRESQELGALKREKGWKDGEKDNWRNILDGWHQK